MDNVSSGFLHIFKKSVSLLATPTVVTTYPMTADRLTRAKYLLAENIRALLRHRGIDDGDLAFFCGHQPSWISKFLNQHRGMSLEDIGKVADFFGLTVSELFSPGISAVTERRGRTRRVRDDRRTHVERRMKNMAHHQRDSDTTSSTLLRPTLIEGVPHGVQQGFAPLDRARPRPVPALTLENIDRAINQALDYLNQLQRLRESLTAPAPGSPGDGETDGPPAGGSVPHQAPHRARRAGHS